MRTADRHWPQLDAARVLVNALAATAVQGGAQARRAA